VVTGGAGCIGSDLCEVLLSCGDDVVALDNLSSGRVDHLTPLLSGPGFRLIEGDLLDPRTLDAALDGAEMVYHLAANPDVKFAEAEPDRDLRQNTLATFQLLEAMRRRGVKRIAFASTSAVYGISPRQPIPEDQAPRPISLYGATKLACEALLSAHQHLFGVQCWVFRFANVVGPKVRKRGRTVIADFIAKLRRDPGRLEVLGTGGQTKSYLLSQECVAMMLHVVERARAPFNVYNLGPTDAISVRRIAEIVVREMGLDAVEFAYTGTEGGWPGDVPSFRLDVSALRRLGWEPRHSSEEAVTTAVRSSLSPCTPYLPAGV
jgi:UDP-glucose 4-epimerase